MCLSMKMVSHIVCLLHHSLHQSNRGCIYSQYIVQLLCCNQTAGTVKSLTVKASITIPISTTLIELLTDRRFYDK